MLRFLLPLFIFLLAVGQLRAQAVGKPNPRHRTVVKTGERHPNNKARFRKEHHPANLDLHIHDPTRFRTAKTNRPYTTGKPGRNRVSRFDKKPIIKLGKGAGRPGSRTLGN